MSLSSSSSPLLNQLNRWLRASAERPPLQQHRFLFGNCSGSSSSSADGSAGCNDQVVLTIFLFLCVGVGFCFLSLLFYTMASDYRMWALWFQQEDGQQQQLQGQHHPQEKPRQKCKLPDDLEATFQPTSMLVTEKDLIQQERSKEKTLETIALEEEGEDAQRWDVEKQQGSNLVDEEEMVPPVDHRHGESPMYEQEDNEEEDAPSCLLKLHCVSPSSSLPSQQADPCRLVSGLCAICLNVYQAGDSISWASYHEKETSSAAINSTSSCPHTFHTACLMEYTRSAGARNGLLTRQEHHPNNKTNSSSASSTAVLECPLCRRPFLTIPLVPLSE